MQGIGLAKLQARRLYILLCEKSLWVYRKANTIKRGWGIDGEQNAPRAQVIVTKNTHKLFHKSLSKAYHAKSVPPNFPTRPYRFSPQTDPSQTLSFRYNRFCIGATEFQLPLFLNLEFPSFLDRCHRVCILTVGHLCRYYRELYIGLNEIQKLLPIEQLGTTEFYTSVSPSWSVKGNGWIFWRCLYIPLHHHSLEKETLRTIP